MEPAAMVVEKLKAVAQSTKDFASNILNLNQNSNRRRNPIEILKRLQRETFSDIMKLRDRQEKAERLLSFYKTTKAGPFQEGGTLVKGEVDMLGALVMTNTIDQPTCDAIQRAGIKNGIESRLYFERSIGERDKIVTEFVGGDRGREDALWAPLSLAKVLFCANMSKWFSAVAIPVGARCRDFNDDTSFPHEEKPLTDYSAVVPPMLNHVNGSAVGIMVRKSNIVASLAQFISVVGQSSPSTTLTTTLSSFSTYGQIVYQLSTSTKLSLMGIQKVLKGSNQQPRLGSMIFPVQFWRQNGQSLGEDDDTNGSMAFMMESRLDESTRIGGWVQMEKKSQPRNVKWAVSMSDTPEDGLGWGLSLGGLNQSPTSSWEHFQVEAFLNFNLGKKCRLQPAILYVRDGDVQFPSLMFRSSFSL
ncbi:unnamed protein product [Cuscuta epithymum]|uniref:Uncharacterized protein n=1 Tax=Cuscuta epithymum TaxID=186058 RepID=A0AAV0F3E2_9ASTE|nr:unnamed protein product [Cuscuta epithymum]